MGEDGGAGVGGSLAAHRGPAPRRSPPLHKRAPWCRPHGVVVSTPGEALGARETPGRFRHRCRRPGSTAASLACPELQGGSAVVNFLGPPADCL